MICFADLPQHTRSRLEEAGSFTETALPLNGLCVYLSVCVCVHRPDCWPKERAELWCCPEQLASHKRGGRRPGPSGLVFTHRSKCRHVTQEDRECHTLHTQLKAAAYLIMAARAAVVSLGFDVQRGRAGWDAVAWYGLPPPCLKSLSGQGLSYLQKEMKTAAMTVIGTLFGRCDKRLRLITICTHPLHQPSCFPGAFKTLLCRHFFFFFFKSSSMKLPLIYSYSKSHSNILHKLCS